MQEPAYPYSLSGDVTVLERGTDKTTVAAGFSGGELRIFNYINKEVVATFRGHRSAVSAITYEKSGSMVASGGCDSDIFLWDLVTLTGKHLHPLSHSHSLSLSQPIYSSVFIALCCDYLSIHFFHMTS